MKTPNRTILPHAGNDRGGARTSFYAATFPFFPPAAELSLVGDAMDPVIDFINYQRSHNRAKFQKIGVAELQLYLSDVLHSSGREKKMS